MNANDQDNDLRSELESLFVNNDKFSRIREHQTRFNPIRVMRMERMEIRHSAILAWLLDPSETHGLGDKFLRAFLSQALKGAQKELPAIVVAEADMRDAEVKREKNSIDIFVSSPRNGWAFVIENKFHSKQHSDQLRRYLIQAKNESEELNMAFKHVGIFLSLEDEKPEDESFAVLNYVDICHILKGLLNFEGARIDPQAKQFIQDYLEIIMDETGMNEELPELEILAKQLYREHKKALDFIIEHGSASGFTLACDLFCGEGRKKVEPFYNDKFLYDRGYQRTLSFVPQEWKELLEQPELKRLNAGCEGWHLGYALACRFDLRWDQDNVGGKLFLLFEVGPTTDSSLRLKLVEAIEAQGEATADKYITIKSSARRPDAKYSRFLRSNSVAVSDVSDSEIIKDKMEAITKKLLPTMDAVTEALHAMKADLKETDE
jgi:hypothetical protein